jgi:hypothetical protein
MKWRFALELFPRGTCFVGEGDAGGGGGGAGGGGDKGAAGAGDKGAGDKGGGGGGDGPFYKDWKLDAEGVKFLEGKGVTEPGAIVKMARDFETVARDRNVIAKPDPKSDKFAEWEGHELLGWVKDPAKYKVNAPAKDKLPEGVTYYGKLADVVSKAAHESRVPLAAAQQIHDALWGHMLEEARNLNAEGARTSKELADKLRTDWGGDYDRNSELARRAMAAFNPSPDNTKLIDGMMGSAALVKMFHAIGEKLGEASLPPASGSSSTFGMSQAQARAERLKLENDKEWIKIFQDPRHPQNKDYKAQRQRLIEIEAGARAA